MDPEHLRKAQAELVSTEETYVDQLRKLCFGQEFLSRHCDNSLQDSIAVVFQHVPTLLELHQELLRKLKLNPERPHEGLLEAVDFLKLTQNYAKAFPHASSTFQRLCEGKKFRALVANLELETNGLTFGSLLITPVQRLPRYRLLMGEILKHTPANSPERLAVEEVYGKVCEVATSVNEYVKRAEAVAKFGQELASLKMGQFRHLLSSESQPIPPCKTILSSRSSHEVSIDYLSSDLVLTHVGSALIQGRASEGRFKSRRLIMFSDMLVLTNSKFVCRAAFRLADITSYHEDPNTMNSLFIEAGNHELTAQFSTATERDQWAAEISQRTVLIKKRELEKLVRASSSLSSPSACLPHHPPQKQPLPRRPLHDATNMRPSPPLKRTLSYSPLGSISHAGASPPPPSEQAVSVHSNLMPSGFSNVANSKDLGRKLREERGDLLPFATPSKKHGCGVSLHAVRYSASLSTQKQLFSPSRKTHLEPPFDPTPSSSQQSNTPSRSSPGVAPGFTSPKFQRRRSPSKEPPKLRRGLQNASLARRKFQLSAKVSSVVPERSRESRGSSDLNSRSRRNPLTSSRELPPSSQSAVDRLLPQHGSGSRHASEELSIVPGNDAYDWSYIRNALDEHAEESRVSRDEPPIAVPKPKASQCPSLVKPVQSAADHAVAHRRNSVAPVIPLAQGGSESALQERAHEATAGESVDDHFGSDADDVWEPISNHLIDNADHGSDDVEPTKAMEGAAASKQDEGQSDREKVHPSPEENFYRAIYFSPERQKEVEQVMRSLSQGDKVPKNLPIYIANRLKATRDEENCFTEERFGMELRTSSVKAFLEQRGMPSESGDVYAFIRCRKLDLAKFWLEQTCFEQLSSILPRCLGERVVVVDLLSKVNFDVEKALHYLMEDDRFQS